MITSAPLPAPEQVRAGTQLWVDGRADTPLRGDMQTLLDEYDRRGAELERLRTVVAELETRPRLEPCACSHARREHASYEDGDGECEDETCDCQVYEARGWEAS